MKCIHCQATLLPVEGELFCLQCGRVYLAEGKIRPDEPVLEETADPILQKAISDGLGHPVNFRLPVAMAPAKPRKANMAALREFMAPPHPALAMAGGGGAMAASAPIEHGVPRIPEPAVTASARELRASFWSMRWLASRWWSVVLPVLTLLVVGNVLIDLRLAGRAYPGVRVAGLSVGDKTEAEIRQALAQRASRNLNITVSGSSYQLATADVASVDVAAVAASAMQIGRSAGLPMIGLATAWFSGPVPMPYQIDQAKLSQAVAKLARDFDRPSHNATPVIIGGQALALAELAGTKLDQAAVRADIKLALTQYVDVTTSAEQLNPLVTAQSLQNSLQLAQQIIDSPVKIAIPKRGVVTVPATTVASWIRFDAATSNVALDTGAVTAYVASLVGSFDRNAAVAGLLEHVVKGAEYTYTAGGKASAVTPVAVISSTPATYRYCIAASDNDNRTALSATAQTALADPAGWALGGQVVFIRQDADCHLHIRIGDADYLKSLSVMCDQQTTCRVGNEIGLLAAAWQQPSDTWKSGIAAYRTELINHEIGHVLGFDHPGCLPDSIKPTLTTQSITLGSGCSPVWHVIGTSGVTTTVLPGFAG